MYDETSKSFSAEIIHIDTESYIHSYIMDKTYYTNNTYHVHAEVALDDKAPTCTENGYEGRTYCEECDSVVEWGTVLEATGHDYKLADEKMTCDCGKAFTGVKDGVTYIDGIAIGDGWHEFESKKYYYLNGEKLVGSHLIENVMYTFDENGIYLENYLYEGKYVVDETIMYFISNEYLTGTHKIGSTIYYFDDNGLGYDGEYTLCEETCLFDDGMYVSCSTAELYDAGWCGDTVEYVVYTDGLLKLGGTGSTYGYKNHGNRPFINYLEDINKIEIGNDLTLLNLNIFAFLLASEVKFEEDSQLTNISTGAFHSMPYLRKINIPTSVTNIGAIAFKNTTRLAEINISTNVKNIDDTAFKGCPSSLLFYVEEGSYAESYAISKGFGTTNEKFVRNGFIEESGELFYYVDGIKWTQRGLFKVGDDYYYAKSGGALLRDTTGWASVTNDLLPKDIYQFDSTGKIVLKKGFVEESGELFYYVDGIKWTQRGLFKVGDDYYYAKSGGALLRDTTGWASVTNDLLPKDIYQFDSTGKIIFE